MAIPTKINTPSRTSSYGTFVPRACVRSPTVAGLVQHFSDRISDHFQQLGESLKAEFRWLNTESECRVSGHATYEALRARCSFTPNRPAQHTRVRAGKVIITNLDEPGEHVFPLPADGNLSSEDMMKMSIAAGFGSRTREPDPVAEILVDLQKDDGRITYSAWICRGKDTILAGPRGFLDVADGPADPGSRAVLAEIVAFIDAATPTVRREIKR